MISCVVFLLFGIFLNPATAQTKISLASTLPNTGLNKVVVDTFVAEMKKAAPDLTIDLFMDGKLGGEKELLEMLKLGETQIQIGTLHSTVYFSELDATSVPYLFPNYATIRAFLSGPIGERMNQALLQKGNGVFLGVFDMGSRWTTSNKKFETLEELKGIKIRIAEIPIWIKVWSGIGATVTPMPAPDVYSALKTGVIDAQDNMLSNILGRKIYEAQKFLINTQHMQTYNTIMAQKTFWNKLTPERKKTFQNAIDVATKAGDDQTKAENERIVKKLQEFGLTLVQPKPEFRTKALPVIEKVAKEILAPGVYDEALKAAAKR
jgi:TRAP-type C4-dicarboxylate transport system substrate-binding protein